MMSCTESDKQEKKLVIIDHDGGVDDLLSQLLVSTMEHVDLLGVSIVPGDCYIAPALESSSKLLTLVGKSAVPIGAGTYEGEHPFPDHWRAEPQEVLTLDVMKAIEQPKLITEKAYELLSRLLANQREQVILLVTGPMGNIAEALKVYPQLKSHIKEIVWMGGAFEVNGNVVQAGHSGVAEWNVYCDPQSAYTVLHSGMPIIFIPLDVTDQVPVSEEFLSHLRKQNNVLSQLAVQFWDQTIAATTGTPDTYYMWDVLATSYLAIPESFTLAKARVDIVQKGVDSGHTRMDDSGVEVRYAKAVDKKHFYEFLLQQLSGPCCLD